MPECLHELNNDSTYLDLYSPVVGEYLNTVAPHIEWASGHQTAVPFLADGKGGNVLTNDKYYARRLASVATHIQDTESSVVVCLDAHVDDNLRDKMANALSEGKCVFVRHAADVSNFELSAEYLRDEYGIPPLMHFDFHGMSLACTLSIGLTRRRQIRSSAPRDGRSLI